MMTELIKRTCLALGVFICLSGHTQAGSPQPTTPAPCIFLSDNLDEPIGFGFFVDTYGRGQTDLLHTHSCKPSKEAEQWNEQDDDIRYSLDPDTGRISSFGFDKMCMQALVAANKSVLALLECSDHPRQLFSYAADQKTLTLQENPSLCLGVGHETLPAPPFVRRPLLLEGCDSLEPSRKQWTIVAK